MNPSKDWCPKLGEPKTYAEQMWELGYHTGYKRGKEDCQRRKRR